MTIIAKLLRNFICVIVAINVSSAAFAADLPGNADASRVDLDRHNVIPVYPEDKVKLPNSMPELNIPEKSKSIMFKLKEIKFEGATAIKPEELQTLYKPYVDKDVTLDMIWIIANQVSTLYHDKGYFLSRAYVPEQEIENGVVKIKVIEGYIGKVEFEGNAEPNYAVKSILESMEAEKPVRISTIESDLLMLDDLPGVSFRAVLEPMSMNGYDGAVKLVLVPQSKQNQFNITYDNYGSRYLGPYEGVASYQGSIIPYQKTSLSVLASTPVDELKYFSINHEIPLPDNFSIEAFGSYTKAHPGYKLEINDVDSASTSLGVALKYQVIRQRGENMFLRLALDGKNSNTDILETELTRDRIRAARFSVNYDDVDSWQGYNNLNVTYSQGLNIFGASQENDLNISRAHAEPDFRKVEFNAFRLQNITKDWGVALASAGQYANESLYSSEEFGYGGQNFGRAYDASEITGDSGIAGSVELRYYGFKLNETITFMPYTFYDVGVVWNKDSGADNDTTGSSAGLGIRLNTDFGLATNLAIAEPLTKQEDAPQTSHSHDPRVLFQLSYGF